MFDPVDPKQHFPALERGILKYWQEEDTFKRSIHQRTKRETGARAGDEAIEESFSFYDGPPFATGLPHYGHILAGTIKDVIPRYQTMRGKRVERRFGWDCHGLPVEYEIEKEHNISSKKEIEEMGIATFNALCRKAVQRYTKEWRTSVERMGRWVDMDHDYRTMDPDYMESIWWVFKQLYDKGLIYEGYKPMHICPRCQTALANFEVMQGYKDISDLSVTVKFELVDEPGTFVLAWTTTPWTLPGNLLLAVGKDIPYALVERAGQRFILAKFLVEKVFAGKDCRIVEDLSAADLVGKKYRPIFPYFADKFPQAFRIVAADFVATEDGTGVVHIAPGFGEDDYNLGRREGIPMLQHVKMDGTFTSDVSDFAGMEVKPKDDPSKTDRKVVEWLEQQEKLFAKETFKHSYPHCWRCDSPLLNYATSSWFVAVEKFKDQMLESNAETQWVPSHLRDGRFGKWLEGAREWAISRNRYWGTPLPIWRCMETGQIEVLGSRDDLLRHKPERFTKITVLRHGESQGNVSPVYQGNVPGTDLTMRGKKQAKEAAKVLGEQDVSCIYASPLARTEQTAKIIAKETSASIIIDDRLREVSFGGFEGKHVDFSDLALTKARRAHKLQHNQIESIFHFSGMETWPEVQERVSGFLSEILSKHRGEHIVIVTHADPLVNMKHFFTKEDPVKLSHQPYPRFAEPVSFYWDHETKAQMDLHKETVDGLLWGGGEASEVHLTCVRHGETELNAQRLAQGSGANDDVSLNETGREQAKETAEKLSERSFDLILSSDSARAMETAKILSDRTGVPLGGALRILGERDLGEWSGQSLDTLLQKHGDSINSKTITFLKTTPDHGESFEALLARAREARDLLLKKYNGKRIVIVSHNGFLRALCMVTQNLSYETAAVLNRKNGEAFELPLRSSPQFQRIPDVLDCWFESGSMPYAQSHFPFSFQHLRGLNRIRSRVTSAIKSQVSSKKARNPKLPPGFPADFIAEGIDQTRGWFYTLTVLSTALFGRSAFQHCIVNGTVLAEDGKKMSKRLKNYPEPLEIVEKQGADAVRFALMNSPAVRGEDLRFSAKSVEDALRSVLLPFWNVYAFFVTYANEAKWEPSETRTHSPHPLDMWIQAETQDLVNRMTEQLERYDLSATCNELSESIDALTNWYVRLSRRRFAGKKGVHAGETGESEQEEDQKQALQTLYSVLLTMSQLLAPFCPFLADAIYLNLTKEPHGSVHLTDWPAPRELTNTEMRILKKTRSLRILVTLGLSLRSEKKIKVRQPLLSATLVLPPSLRDEPFTDEELSLLQEELNVKRIDVRDDAAGFAHPIVQVDARKVGPRLGGRVQEIIAAGKRGEFTEGKDGSILIGEERLSPDEAKIVYVGDEGLDIAADKGFVVSLDTHITEALQFEGCGRDLIRAIQQERKGAGMAIGDRIVLSIIGADDVLSACKDAILQETNAVLGEASGEDRHVEINGKDVIFRLQKL